VTSLRPLFALVIRHPGCCTTGIGKPYDIKERAFLFSCDAMLAAEAAASRTHFVTLSRGALRELREACYWIRLIGATKLPFFLPFAFCLLHCALLSGHPVHKRPHVWMEAPRRFRRFRPKNL